MHIATTLHGNDEVGLNNPTASQVVASGTSTAPLIGDRVGKTTISNADEPNIEVCHIFVFANRWGILRTVYLK